jgi:hypothetical protein
MEVEARRVEARRVEDEGKGKGKGKGQGKGKGTLLRGLEKMILRRKPGNEA